MHIMGLPMRYGKDPNYRVVAIARPDTRIGHRTSEDIHQQPLIRGGICGLRRNSGARWPPPGGPLASIYSRGSLVVSVLSG
jgi:hypothetical protein